MTEDLYRIYLEHRSVQTDTRKLKKGDLFFALRGPQFNGNKFASEAIERGAAFAIIDDPAFAIEGKTILVNDALAALQRLATEHRKKFRIPFIAITGSNGKTTTKELIHAVLSSTYMTYTTVGNLNNHIGVPLTILGIRENAEIAVIEMGANHLHEIESYCTIAMPTCGLITNCGKAHLEGFGSEEGVRKGKGELFDYLRAHGGTAFIMQDYDYLREMSKGIREVITYGTRDADITGSAGSEKPFLHVNIQKGMAVHTVTTKLVGGYNLPNVLAAVAVGKYFQVPDERAVSAIGNYVPANSRSQWLEKGTNTYILDAYNANPSSMKPAIENFAEGDTENKVLLLGAMAELGDRSLAEHEEIIRLINKYNWKKVILVGGEFLHIDHPYLQFENAEQAGDWIRKANFENTAFLIKGSRSIGMEKILEA